MDLQEMLIQFLKEYGYIGIAVLIFVENMFPPIPSEAVLLFGGFMTTYTDMNPWILIFASTIGSVAGAFVLYKIGHWLDKERLSRLISGKIGRVLRLKPEHIDKAEAWFERHGYSAVFFGRCVPIVRSLISVPAGMAKMPLRIFTLLTVAGSALWNIVLIWAGKWSGSAWESNLKYLGWYSKVALAVLAIVFVLIVWKLIRKNKKEV